MSARLILSRRALGVKLVSPAYQHRLKQDAMQQSVKSTPIKDATSWPRSLQIAGYTVIALAIPYSTSVILVESRDLRTWLEEKNWGQSIIQAVRWYWGEEESIPYGPILEEAMKQQGTKQLTLERPVSLIGKEDSSQIRWEQERIQERIHSLVKVSVWAHLIAIPPLLQPSKRINNSTLGTMVDSNISTSSMPGTICIHDIPAIQKETREDITDGHHHIDSIFNQPAFSFPAEDYDLTEGLTSTPDLSLHEITNDTMRGGTRYTIWSAWHHFKTTVSSQDPTSSTNRHSVKYTYDDLSLKIDEVEYHISELQRNMNDPAYPRDRDDMEKELRQLRSQLSKLKRYKVWRGIKNLLYLN